MLANETGKGRAKIADRHPLKQGLKLPYVRK